MADIVDVVVVGAGIGGLAAATRLAAAGLSVVVVERSAQLGGKMRTVSVAGRMLDAGPTVLTMRHVFDELFHIGGARLDDCVRLEPLDVIARHTWPDGERLDLFCDRERTADAIAQLAGTREADGYRRFCSHVAAIHRRVEPTFMASPRRSLLRMVRQGGIDMLRVDWHRSLWRALGSFFRDPRLRQLFGRYATYYGSSPFEAPATLGVIAHVEQEGVWRVDGGMHALAVAMGERLRTLGAEIVLGADVTEISIERGFVRGVELAGGGELRARAVVINADPRAVANGRFGEAARVAVQPPSGPASLSAITFAWVGRATGFDLAHHSVFFSSDYAAEFRSVFGARKVPAEPTVYVCAQDRGEPASAPDGPERIFALINAPACGDEQDFGVELDRWRQLTLSMLHRGGLRIDDLEGECATTPTDFAAMFPGSGGSLYGPATHSAFSAFGRPGASTNLRGLFLVGGGAHPGAGVPMVAMGGRWAAEGVLEELDASSKPSRVNTSRSLARARF
jgi:1-hydroxycarotenoid 3,4-desaturase